MVLQSSTRPRVYPPSRAKQAACERAEEEIGVSSPHRLPQEEAPQKRHRNFLPIRSSYARSTAEAKNLAGTRAVDIDILLDSDSSCAEAFFQVAVIDGAGRSGSFDVGLIAAVFIGDPSRRAFRGVILRGLAAPSGAPGATGAFRGTFGSTTEG
jgi:hypothetical protein